MSKGLLYFTIGLFVVGISLLGYGLITQLTDPVRGGIEHYLEVQIGELAPLEEKAVNAYQRFEMRRDDDKLEAALENFILPNYGKFRDGINAIEPQVEELEAIHEKLIEAVNTIYDGLSLRLESVEQRNTRLRRKAESKLRQGSQMRDEWRGELKTLAALHGVMFE